MKRFILCLMAIVFAGVMTSCEDLEGEQTPIKLDNSELTFTSVGGEQTVTAVNYNSWWINGAYESMQSVNGVSEYIKTTYNYTTPVQNIGIPHCNFINLGLVLIFISIFILYMKLPFPTVHPIHRMFKYMPKITDFIER